MKKSSLLAYLGLFLFALTFTSIAQQPVPVLTVKKVSGTVSIHTSPVSDAVKAQTGVTIPTNGWIKTGPRSFVELESSDQNIIRLGSNSIYNYDGKGNLNFLDQGSMLIRTKQQSFVKTAYLSGKVNNSTVYVEANGSHGELNSSVYVLESANGVGVLSSATNSGTTLQKGQAVRSVSKVKKINESAEKFNINTLWAQNEIMQHQGALDLTTQNSAPVTSSAGTVVATQSEKTKDELKQEALEKAERAKQEGLKKKEAAEEKQDALQERRIVEAQKDLEEVKETKNRSAVKDQEEKIKKLQQEAQQDDLPKP